MKVLWAPLIQDVRPAIRCLDFASRNIQEGLQFSSPFETFDLERQATIIITITITIIIIILIIITITTIILIIVVLYYYYISGL